MTDDKNDIFNDPETPEQREERRKILEGFFESKAKAAYSPVQEVRFTRHRDSNKMCFIMGRVGELSMTWDEAHKVATRFLKFVEQHRKSSEPQMQGSLEVTIAPGYTVNLGVGGDFAVEFQKIAQFVNDVCVTHKPMGINFAETTERLDDE